MHDVARESGVSPMTVSRVLAGRQKVRPETRRRVEEAARKLDYVPNALASSFARNRAGFIGVATPFRGLLGTAFFREMMMGFQQAIEGTELDFALFDCASAVFSNPKGLGKIYHQKKAGGLLIIAPRMDDDYLKTLGGMGVAFMVVGEYVSGKNVPSVCCDDRHGIELMLQHLRELGHREIGFIGGPPLLGSARRREAAFLEGIEEAGLPSPRHFRQAGDYTVTRARAAALRMLGQARRPSAILCANDLSAKGAIIAAGELGLRVPQDLSIAGFDDLLPPGENETALTTIHQSLPDIAAVAVQKLLQAMETGVPIRGHVDVDVSLVVRSSTGPA